jgi:hypothetical protein
MRGEKSPEVGEVRKSGSPESREVGKSERKIQGKSEIENPKSEIISLKPLP